MSLIQNPVELRVTVDDPALARAVQQIAAEQARPLPDVVAEALREWLERQEEQEDLAAITEADGDETVPWEQVKAKLQIARDAHVAG